MSKPQDITNNTVNRGTSANDGDPHDTNELTLQLDEKKDDAQFSVKSESTEVLETEEIMKDPKSWPRRKKNMILFIISLAGVIGPLASTFVNHEFFAIRFKKELKHLTPFF